MKGEATREIGKRRIQLTPDNSNLQGKANKIRDIRRYRKFELPKVKLLTLLWRRSPLFAAPYNLNAWNRLPLWTRLRQLHVKGNIQLPVAVRGSRTAELKFTLC